MRWWSDLGLGNSLEQLLGKCRYEDCHDGTCMEVNAETEHEPWKLGLTGSNRQIAT